VTVVLKRFCSCNTNKTASKRIITGVNLSIFLSTLGVGVFAFAFPLMAQDKNIAGSWLGAAFSGYFFAKLILAPLAGAWADKKGARRLLLSASFWGFLLPVSYALHPAILSLYIIQFGLGLVTGIIKPLGTAIIGSQSWDFLCRTDAQPRIGGHFFSTAPGRSRALVFGSLFTDNLFDSLFLPAQDSTFAETCRGRPNPSASI
jgi:MFS family permease